MPYVLVSAQTRVTVGPTVVGDEWSDEKLMEQLGATKVKEPGNIHSAYVTQSPPRVVLNQLENLGYTVIGVSGIGQTCLWTLHKKD